MAVEVEMPQLSDTMEKGTIVRWLKNEGDHVERGDVLAEVETDKATMDLEAFDEGVLLKTLVGEGEDAPTQSLIAVIGEEGEDISDILAAGGPDDEGEADREEKQERSREESQEEEEQPSAEPAFEETPDATENESEQVEDASEPPADRSETESTEPEAPEPASSDGEGELRVSPVARRMAAENRIDLFELEGSGPEGRIIKKKPSRGVGRGWALSGTVGDFPERRSRLPWNPRALNFPPCVEP